MIRVSKRASVVRCVVCHAEDGELATCPGCEAWAHVDCRREVGRCPTLGCSTAIEPTAGALPSALDVAVARADGRTHVAANGALVRPPTPDAESEVARIMRRLSAEAVHRREIVEQLDAQRREREWLANQRTDAVERETAEHRRFMVEIAWFERFGLFMVSVAAWFLLRLLLRVA